MKQLVLIMTVLFLTSSSALALESTKSESSSSSMASLKDWDLLKKADTELANGRVPTTLDQIDDSSGLVFYRNVLKAQVALKQNKVLEVLSLLSELPSAPDAQLSEDQLFFRTLYYKALLTKKTALETLGKDTNEIDQTIWAYFPDLDKSTNSLPKGLSGQETKNRLHVLYVRQDWGSVVALAPSIGSLNDNGLNSAEKCQMIYEWAESARQAKKSDLALQGFDAVSAGLCEGEKLNRALYWKAKFEVSFKKTDQAIKTYEQAIRLFPNGRYTDDAYYNLNQLYEKMGNKSKANAALHHLLGLSKGDMKAKLLWEEGYEAYKKKQYGKAIEKFDRMISMDSINDESQPQALYWKARALNQQNKNEAKNIYQRVAHDYPFSFYAVLASHRLGVAPTSIPVRKIGGSSSGLLSLVDGLNKVGRHDDALEALDFFAQTEKARATKDLALMSEKYLESGDYHRAMMIAHEYFDSSPSSAVFDKGNSMISTLFPLVYPEAVSKAAQQSGLAKGMIEGIMREESLFQSSVVSHAGAIGLMQLMPATATMQASSSGIAGFSVSRLNQPSLNITIGADFFAKMIRQFDGQVPLAIMAYNAGPGNVRKWLGSNGHLPLDEFVEEIPFRETKGYVKRVLRSIQVYGVLHNEERLKKPFISFKLKS